MTQPREEVEKWAALSDAEWVALNAPKFADILPRCQLYAKFLEAVLRYGCAELAPLALVETRAKSLPSFAEKILRKRKQYMATKGGLSADPLARLTDLCGGRVIAQTSEQVQALCRFVEEAFAIDWSNSEDVSQRLRPTEFGYRSVHYIISVDEKKLREAGVAIGVPGEIIGLKAEVQVRTLLEHTWADIGHDMTYKADMKVPARIHRQFASLAAVLEGVDRQFAALVKDLDEFKSNFGAYHERKEVDEEIVRLRIVLSYDPENVDLAVKIAQLALSIGRHEAALEVLEPYAARGDRGVERVRGAALVEMHWDRPQGKEYLAGRQSLQAACGHPKQDAETLCALAESWSRSDATKARKLYHQAVAVDATEPTALARYLEFEISHVSNNTVARLAAPMIRNAIDRCRKQIEARVNLPWAWSGSALLHLLVEEPYRALESLGQLIRLCEPCAYSSRSAEMSGISAERDEYIGRISAAERALRRTGDALKRLECIREKLPGFDWCQRAVVVGLAAAVEDRQAAEALREIASWGDGPPHIAFDERIVFLAGGCTPELQKAVDAFREILLTACEGLSFTLISGGTTAGISGVAGDVAERSGAQKSGGRVKTFGYLPKYLPRGAEEDMNPRRYAGRFNSAGSDFSPLDPLQAWTDILAAGVDPRRVKLIYYAGGQISRSECILALALGGEVGAIEDAALPKNRHFNEPEWRDCASLVQLPLDPMSIRAFLLVDELPIKQEEFGEAARKAHEAYIQSATADDASLQKWEDLSEDLKISNYHRVVYMENILRTVGLGIRAIADREKPPADIDMEKVLGEAGVTRLAEMEHGRWTVERLLRGWRWAEEKDVARRLSPHLVAWNRLSPLTQSYDLQGIRDLPKTLREAGLEVYRLDEPGEPS